MQAMRLVRTVVAAVIVVASIGAGPVAHAQAYPTKPITIIVPFPAGGGTSDLLARVVAQKLTEAWGQPVIVENKPGASGNIGASMVAKAAPDGYTLLVAAAAISTAPALYKDPGFKLFENLTPVTVIGTVPFMLVVHPTLPVTNIAEFIAYAKANPSKLSLGSGGNGTIPHLGGELLKMRAGIQFEHIPYKGGILAMNDLVGGQIQFTIDGGSHVVTQIDAGKIRLLAVTSAQRLPAYPNVPTVAESGFPGYEASAWQMLLVPGGTPKPIVDKIQQEVAKALKSPDVAERLQKLGIAPSGIAPAETDAFLRAEMLKWGDVVKKTGAKID